MNYFLEVQCNEIIVPFRVKKRFFVSYEITFFVNRMKKYN